jgi:hypothetical protein
LGASGSGTGRLTITGASAEAIGVSRFLSGGAFSASAQPGQTARRVAWSIGGARLL